MWENSDIKDYYHLIPDPDGDDEGVVQILSLIHI